MRRVAVVLALALLALPMVAGAQSMNPPVGGTASDPADTSYPILWDDFLTGGLTSGTIGQLGWSFNGTSIVSSTYTLFADRPGLLGFQNAASATGGVYTPGGSVTRYANIDRLIFWVAAATGANDPSERVGLLSGSMSVASNDDGAYFEHLNTDTNWFAVTQDGAAATRRDTNVPFVANTFFRLEIRHPSTNTWLFYINNSPVATGNSGNLPTESYLCFFAYQMTTNGTVVNGFLDYFWARLKTTR